jgi:WD40 repeat protein/energy-coupling factor transporter ATP-binding protein EcfA2
MTNVPIPSPFVGLRPFDRDDAHLFFGRDEQVDALTACLRERRFVAVMGTSGSGKSSLVRAGLLPALEGGGVAACGTGWSIAVMTPGANPIGNLAAALARAGVIGPRSMPADHHHTTLEAILRRGALGLVDAVRESRLGRDDSLLVFVDQFEEIFRFKRLAESAGNQDHAAAFVKLLLTALRQSSPAIYVMLTMRSEFLGEAAEFRDLPEAINDALFLVPRLTRDQLTQAICGPIAVGGGKITPSLVQRLLNDVGDDPDQLPVLQHALMRTWKQWCVEGAMPPGLTIEHYQTVKELSGALSEHADQAFLEIDEGQRAAAATIFKALTERGPDGREVRRPTSVRELADVAGVRVEDVIAIVEPFRRKGRSFLRPSDTQVLTADTVLDISHESLMRKWKRLRDWIAQEAEDRRIFLRLSDSAAQHAAGEEPLLRDPRLSFVAQWRHRFAPGEAWARRYAPNFKEAVTYLDTSLTTRRRERRRRQVFRSVLASALVLIVGGGAYWHHSNEDQQRRIEIAQRDIEIAAEKAKVKEQDAALEAEQRLSRVRQDLAAFRANEQEAKERQHADEIRRGEEAARQVAALKETLREAQRLAISASAEAARANPAESERAALVALRTLSDAERANDAAGAKTAMAALTEQIRLMPVVRLKEELGSAVSVLGASGHGILAAVSPSSRLSPQVHIWRVGAGRVSPARAPGHVTALGAWDSTGRTTAWISEGTVHVWDEELGEGPVLALAEGGRPTRLTLSPDGRYVMVARGANGADLWSLTTKTSVHLDAGAVDDMACAADGRSCVTATRGIVRLWNTETGAQVGRDLTLKDSSVIRSVTLSSTGSLLAVAAAANWIEVWRVARDEDGGATFSSIGPRTQPHQMPVTDIAISPNERFLASASEDGTAAIFTLPPGASSLGTPQRLSHGRTSVLRVAFSPDHDAPDLATAASDGAARLWRKIAPTRGSPVMRWTEHFRVPHTGRVSALAFLDVDLLASADEKGVVRVSSSPGGAVPTSARELMNAACGRVSRTLTAAEWMSYFRLQPYESLCGLPLDPRQVLEFEIAHAQAGNAVQARQAARQLAGMTDTRGLDPLKVASAASAQARIRNTDVAREHFKLAVSLAQAVKGEERAGLSNEVCWQGAVNGFAADVVKACDDAVRTEPESTDFLTDAAIAYARAGNRGAASERFAQAAHLTTARPRGPGSENNEVCWRGSIYDFAHEVRDACDAAVAASQKNAAYLDSQAVAYALIGTPDLLKKAKENFKYFVDNPGNYPRDIVAKRESWCDELDKGRNPFARDRRRGVLAELAKDFEQQRAGLER